MLREFRIKPENRAKKFSGEYIGVCARTTAYDIAKKAFSIPISYNEIAAFLDEFCSYIGKPKPRLEKSNRGNEFHRGGTIYMHNNTTIGACIHEYTHHLQTMETDRFPRIKRDESKQDHFIVYLFNSPQHKRDFNDAQNSYYERDANREKRYVLQTTPHQIIHLPPEIKEFSQLRQYLKDNDIEDRASYEYKYMRQEYRDIHGQSFLKIYDDLMVQWRNMVCEKETVEKEIRSTVRDELEK